MWVPGVSILYCMHVMMISTMYCTDFVGQNNVIGYMKTGDVFTPSQTSLSSLSAKCHHRLKVMTALIASASLLNLELRKVCNTSDCNMCASNL